MISLNMWLRLTHKLFVKTVNWTICVWISWPMSKKVVAKWMQKATVEQIQKHREDTSRETVSVRHHRPNAYFATTKFNKQIGIGDGWPTGGRIANHGRVENLKMNSATDGLQETHIQTLGKLPCWFSFSIGFRLKKVAHTRLPNVRFQSWSRFSAVSLQVTWVINPAVGCHHFPPGPQLPSQPLRGLLPVSLLGEQRHDVCEQFA